MKKIFINAQIRKLRKALKLNQAEFGERIGLKQGAISRVEQEGVPVTEQNIKLICEKFNVRRDWLLEGTGEMLQQTEDALFEAFAEKHHLSKDDQVLAKYLLGLSSEKRQKIIAHIKEIAELIRQKHEQEAAENPDGLTSEELAIYEKVKAVKEKNARRADLHRQLDEGLVAEEKGAAAYSSISSKKQA